MSQIYEIRFHGRGGQGAKTAAQVLGEGAMMAGRYTQAFPEYGPERSGAPMQAFVRISDEPIRLHSNVRHPDMVIVIDPGLLDSVDVTDGLEEGKIIVNSSDSADVIKEKLHMDNKNLVTVSARSIAEEVMGNNMVNIPILGAVAGMVDFIEMEDLEKAVRDKLEDKLGKDAVNANVEAMKKVYEEVTQL